MTRRDPMQVPVAGGFPSIDEAEAVARLLVLRADGESFSIWRIDGGGSAGVKVPTRYVLRRGYGDRAQPAADAHEVRRISRKDLR